VDDVWLLSLDISVKSKKTGRYFDMNTITIGELSQASRPLFNIVYCNNNNYFLDDIPIKYESSETTRAMGVLEVWLKTTTK
jgi:hypothetical protein